MAGSFASTVNSVTAVSIMGGVLYAKKDGDATWRDTGIVSDCTLNVASEKQEIYDGRCAIKELRASKVTKATYTLPTVFNSITDENLKWLLSGTVETVTEAIGSGVTENKALTKDTTDGAAAYAQIGETTSTPNGERNITINSITHTAGAAASGWAATTAYAVGDVVDAVAIPDTHAYICTVAGTSAGTEPTWPADGTTVVDATVTWQDIGLVIMSPADYVVNAVEGLVYIKSTTNMIDAQVYTINYDRAASTRARIKSGGTSTTLAIKIVGCADPASTSKTFLFGECSIEPNGDLQMISNEASYAQIPVTFSGLKPANGTETVYIDGLPILT